MYFVVTIRANGESRCVGYFSSKKRARETIESNLGDIYEEGYYRFALVEELGQGLYPVPSPIDGSHETWYEWKRAHTVPSHTIQQEGSPPHHREEIPEMFYEAGYKLCDKPKKFSKVLCWAVG